MNQKQSYNKPIKQWVGITVCSIASWKIQNLSNTSLPLLQLLLLGFPFAIPALQFICSMLCYIFDKVINFATTLQQHNRLFKNTLQPEEIVITHLVSQPCYESLF